MEHWLNIDSKVSIEENAKQRILIINPEALSFVSTDELWNKITGTLGKYEYEIWLAETIKEACNQATRHFERFTEITKISDATLLIKQDEIWEVFMTSQGFKKALINLPIFRIVKNTSEAILLKIVIK